MTGTLVNVAGIAAGTLLGMAFKKGIPEALSQSIIKAEGLGILLIGLIGVLKSMLRVDPATGGLSDAGSLLLLLSLVLGCVAGELLRIDDRLNTFGARLGARFGSGGFAAGFVNASLIFSVGAMAVVGALNEGLTGDASTLLMKLALDFTTAIVLSSTLGIGVLFSAVPVLILQGGITLLAGALSPFITETLLATFCMVGYTLVLAIGINFIFDAKIKVANLMPAMLIPILYALLPISVVL